MTYGYSELILADGILVAPFVAYAAGALLLFALLRPLLARLPLDRTFANPPVVEFCVYILLVAILLVAF